MKKIYLVILSLLLFVVFIFPQFTIAAYDPAKGLVPCGHGTPTYATDGSCTANCPCTINDFFKMLADLYEFVVWYIASPLAILMITIGGVLMLVSAGNPNLFGLGKKTVYAAIIGIILVFGALLIINSILGLMGIAPIS